MKRIISFEERIANPGADLVNPERILTNTFQVGQEMTEKVITDPVIMLRIKEKIMVDINRKRGFKKYFPNLYKLIFNDEKECNIEEKNHLCK